MLTSKKDDPLIKITITNKGIEQLQTFRYLGCLINNALDTMREIKSGIQLPGAPCERCNNFSLIISSI